MCQHIKLTFSVDLNYVSAHMAYSYHVSAPGFSEVTADMSSCEILAVVHFFFTYYNSVSIVGMNLLSNKHVKS